jgi:hypothetical protein
MKLDQTLFEMFCEDFNFISNFKIMMYDWTI